jgi:hypothetical protein
MSFRCKFMDGCPMYDLITTSVRIMQLLPFLNGYCLDRGNFTNCARFHIIESGKEPSADLLPDGKRLKA